MALGKLAEQLNKQLIESDSTADFVCRMQGRTQTATRILEAIAATPAKLKQYNEPQS